MDTVQQKVDHEVGQSNSRIARIAAIAKLIDDGRIHLGIAMLCYKTSLLDHARKFKNRKITTNEANRIAHQMTLGAYQLYTIGKTIHGDIALRNFLVDEKDRIFITDFGLAHKLQHRDRSAEYLADYMAVKAGLRES